MKSTVWFFANHIPDYFAAQTAASLTLASTTGFCRNKHSWTVLNFVWGRSALLLCLDVVFLYKFTHVHQAQFGPFFWKKKNKIEWLHKVLAIQKANQLETEHGNSVPASEPNSGWQQIPEGPKVSVTCHDIQLVTLEAALRCLLPS